MKAVQKCKKSLLEFVGRSHVSIVGKETTFLFKEQKIKEDKKGFLVGWLSFMAYQLLKVI